MALKRELGMVPLVSIVLANMIGVGIFTTSGLIMAELGNPWILLLLWVLGGIIALCGALSYSELGAEYPFAGGEYMFLSRLYHPALGFICGWVSFIVGFSAPIAASSMGISEYLCRVFPCEIFFIGPVFIKKTISIFIIVLFTLLHSLSLKESKLTQNLLTGIKVFLILLVLIAGFAWGTGDMDHFLEGERTSLDFSYLKKAGISLVWVMFAFSGWNAATYLGSEIRDPSKNIKLSLLWGAGLVTLLYLALNVLFIYALAPGEMSGVISIGGLAVNRLFGASFDRIYSLFIAISLLSSVSAYIWVGPRIYYAMAERNHFFRFAASLNRKNIPVKSLVVQSLIAVAFVLSGAFSQVLTVLGFALGIFPIISIAGIFILRRKKGYIPRWSGFPYAQIIFIVMYLLILVLAFLERPLESGISLAIVLSGAPVYYWLYRRRGWD